MRKNLFKSLLAGMSLSICLSVFGFQAHAGFTYEGSLVDPSGNVVTNSSVQFVLEILSPGSEACVLFRESHTLDMSASEGYFSLNVGTGTVMGSYPTLLRVFQNHGTMNGLSCATGSTYAPGINDVRRMRVTIYVGGGAADVVGTLTINPVPMADTARTVGAFEAQSLLRAVDGSNNPVGVPAFNPAQVTELTNLIAGTSSLYAPAGGSGPVGAAGGDLVGTYPNPMLANSGVTAGTYGASNMVPVLTVDPKGRVVSISANAINGLMPMPGAAGEVLRSNGTAWVAQGIRFNDIRNSVGGSAFNTGACMANQTVKWSSLTDTFECQIIGALDASAIASGVIPPVRLGIGSANTSTFLRGDGAWAPLFSGLAANSVPRFDGAGFQNSAIFDAGGNVGIGTNTPSATLSVNGTLRFGDDGVGCNSGRIGVLRFFTGKMQVCDGSMYTDIGGSQISETTGSGSTADFSTADTVIFPTASSASISLNGVNAGMKKRLIILNASAYTYTFSGSCSTSVYSPANAAVTAASKVIYEIYRINYNGTCFITWKTYN
ncbi:hypothetical protein AZI86_01380 [Bdellovibrio bacteriovorus]|uniref:Cell wall surface anchor family protein n=1 Tax=Bdellovibrio bacteriovorus TaxID=959 RepID=A0A150WN05_BDEBC|nr:hypothetical protein [Bdellovibrio bacteriovorus]KYG65756.1 hypothetical protein AZI86_01380 [Bdellovibrio bacteriovorus]